MGVQPDAVHSPAPRRRGLSGGAKLRNVARLRRVTENKRDDEDRSGRQYRRLAPHGEAAAAEDRLRFHRRRLGRRARPRNQHLGLSQAQIVASLPRRCFKTRPVEVDLWPDLCEPVRHLADRRREPLSQPGRPDARRGRARREYPLHHVGRQQRFDRSGGQDRAKKPLVSALRSARSRGQRRPDQTDRGCRARRIGADGRHPSQLKARAQYPQWLCECPRRAISGVEPQTLDPRRSADPSRMDRRIFETRGRHADARQLAALRAGGLGRRTGLQAFELVAPVQCADLARSRDLSQAVPARARRKRYHEPGRCVAGARCRLRRHPRLQPWRAPARSGARLARCVAGDQGRSWRQADLAAGQRGPPRRRYPDRTVSRRRFLLFWPSDALRRRRRRIGRGQEGDRHLCQRDRPRHGADRLPEPRSAGSGFPVARRLGAQRLIARDLRTMNFDQAINIEDLHRIAKRKLPKIIFDYIEGGVEDERGLARNEAAFHKHRLLPRYLVDVSKRDQSVSVFGRSYASPFGISPTGGVGLYRREGEVMLAQAAAAANIPYIMSGGSNASMEEALRVAPNNVWFQLYAAKDANVTDALIGRARDGGAGALVLTVDVPVHPKRERNYRNGFPRIRRGGVMESLKLKPSILLEAITHPAWVAEYMRLGGAPTLGNWAPHAGNGASTEEVIAFGRGQTPAAAQTWRDLERYRRLFPRALVVKGILNPADAVRAAEIGVDGIIVSNHGGRQLDQAPASLEA